MDSILLLIYCAIGNTYIPIYPNRLEILFFPKLKKNSWHPLNQSQMMSNWLPLKKIFINPTNKLVWAHFHFYIIYKFNNKVEHIINCLDSSEIFIIRKRILLQASLEPLTLRVRTCRSIDSAIQAIVNNLYFIV